MQDELDALKNFVAECRVKQDVGPPSLSHALAIIAPGGPAFTVGKPTSTIDINLFHASTGHVNEFSMRETAKQQGVQLVGELQPCVGCIEAKGRRAPVPRRGVTRAAVPFGKVHIDITGPYSEAFDGSRYLIMFVDSASRWQLAYGMRAKSDTLTYTRRFLADLNGNGPLGCFRMDNAGEFTSAAFVAFCDAAGIRREYTAPDTPAGVVPSTSSFPSIGTAGVVPSASSIPSTTSGVIPQNDVSPSIDVDVVPTSIRDFQPALAAAIASSDVLSPSVVNPNVSREIEIMPLESQDNLPLMDMSMFLDVGLMNGQDSDQPGDFYPDPLGVCESVKPPVAFAVMQDELDALKNFVAECRVKQDVGPPSLSHALAIIAPGGPAFTVGKPTSTIDINLFHASTGHVNEFLMRETAKQQGVQLVGELQPCVGCIEAKGRRAPVPRRGVTRAAVPFGKVHIDITGPYSEAFDGSRYLIMLGQCVAVATGNAVVESAIWRAMKGGHAARRHVLSMGHFDLASIPGMDANRHRLWLASAIWASSCFNRSATSANPAWMSPFEAFFGRKPPLKVVPFFQEGMMRVKRASKADVQSVRCFYLHGARNHSDATAVVLRADTGRICLSNNVVWINRRTVVPAPAMGAGGPAGGPGGMHMFAAMFATREDVEATLRAKRPPDKTPDLPHCLASDLRVPKTFKEAMRSQHSELWDDAVGREFFGLLDAGTFSPV
ncbi:unnamed protein product [Ectocarpus sp. CCAP 1310/34]|nr:unnamed protein product [Ectocarpus sp. CCAP 1310/34]